MRGASWTQFFLLQFHFILSVRLKSINTGSFWIAGLSVNPSQIRRVGDAASKGQLSVLFCWSELGFWFHFGFHPLWTRYFHIGKYVPLFLWVFFETASECPLDWNVSTALNRALPSVCLWGSNRHTHAHTEACLCCADDAKQCKRPLQLKQLNAVLSKANRAIQGILQRAFRFPAQKSASVGFWLLDFDSPAKKNCRYFSCLMKQLWHTTFLYGCFNPHEQVFDLEWKEKEKK